MAATGGANNPADPQSWNRYSYVQNDPVNFRDPQGLFMCSDCGQDRDYDAALPEGGGGGDNSQGGSGGGKGGGVGGGRSALNPTELAHSFLRSALETAIDALKGNEDCMKLFGNEKTRAGGFDPVDVLSDIVNHALSDTRSSFGSISLGSDSGYSVSLDRTIHIGITNWNGWGAADIRQNAHTLLHELGHVYDLLSGSGNSVIRTPDALPRFVPVIGGDRRTRWNDWKVDQDCFHGTLGYKKP